MGQHWSYGEAVGNRTPVSGCGNFSWGSLLAGFTPFEKEGAVWLSSNSPAFL